MGRIVVTEFVSLDGVMEDPGGGENFRRGGWSFIDELRLMVFPVVLGTGKRLFGETSDKRKLRLTSSKTVGDGVSIQVYEPVA